MLKLSTSFDNKLVWRSKIILNIKKENILLELYKHEVTEIWTRT